jgi:hypothetical protein
VSCTTSVITEDDPPRGRRPSLALHGNVLGCILPPSANSASPYTPTTFAPSLTMIAPGWADGGTRVLVEMELWRVLGVVLS